MWSIQLPCHYLTLNADFKALLQSLPHVTFTIIDRSALSPSTNLFKAETHRTLFD